ncbi:hypothetical protein Tco_0633161 [Tanacetum coccineum]
MSNQSEDIQAAGSDTRPPMLDRTDFESWQQRIRLYCKGKDHEEYILQSIDEGPFKMGWCRDEIATGTDGPYLGLERDIVVADLSQAEKDRLRADIRAMNILLQGLPRDIYKLINHNTDAKDIRDNVKMLLEGSELTKDDHESQPYDEFKHFEQHKGENIHDYYVRIWGGAQYKTVNANAGQGKTIKCYNCNGIENGVDLDEEQLLFLAGGQTNTFDDEEDEGPVHDMTQNEDNIFQADQCDAFDSDVDEAPTAQTMFMANLSSADPMYDEAGPSYDSDTLSEVQDHNNYLDNMNESHEEHEIHNDVQPNNVVDSDTAYTSNSNIISYEQYVQDNKDQVVHSDVSSVPNDAVMIITNDIYEQDTPSVTSNNTVNASLTVELARYEELAEVYEKRAQFKLTGRELMIDTQTRMIIKDRNVKEESLQKELHSVKYKMAEENLHAPTRSDEQLVPAKARLPYGKSNLLLDLQKLQKNLIFCISVDILQNTNFFRAFSASANVPSIYIQQLWNTDT